MNHTECTVALSLLIIQVCAVVIRLDCGTFGLVGVCVEGIEMGADPLYGCEVLALGQQNYQKLGVCR